MSRDLNEFTFKDSPELPPADLKRVSPAYRSLGCAVLSAVLIVGVILGLGFFVLNKCNQAAWASQDFFKKLQQQKIDDAYSATSTSFQSEMSRPEFEEFVARYPLFSRHVPRSQDYIGPLFGQLLNRAKFRFTLFDPKLPTVEPSIGDDPTDKKTKSIFCTVTVILEDGQWVVDAITVP